MPDTRNFYEIAPPQLAVDRDIEHREIPDAAVVPKACAKGPDVLGLERRLGAMIWPWFHETRGLVCAVVIVGSCRS